MRKLLFFVLMFGIILAGCDAPPTNAACYTYDFAAAAANSANTPINIQSGQWLNGIGLQTVNDELIFNWSEIFFINPSSVSVRVMRPAGVVGDIFVDGFIVDAFSVSIANGGLSLPSGMDEFTITRNDSASSEGKSFNATVQTAAPLVIRSVTIYVDGANPFPRNDCAPATETPTRTPSHTPPPQTVTPFMSPTVTRTPLPPTTTFTPLPPSSTPTTNPFSWCREWDFSSGAAGWNITLGAAAANGYTTVYHYSGQNAYRIVEIRQNFTGTVTRADVEFDYTAGVRDATGDAAFLLSANTYTNQLVRINVPTIPGSPQAWTGSQYVSSNMLISLIVGARGYSPADPNGSGTIKKITLRGTGSNPFGLQNCDIPPTPLPSSTPLPATATPAPPTATRTPLVISGGFTLTPSPTGITVATRTPLPTNTAPPPTSIPPTQPPMVFPTLPPTGTPPPTSTPPPTGTYIAPPTEIYNGSSTPWATYPAPNLTPLPNGGINGLSTPIPGTLVGTPQPGQTTIPQPDDLSEFHSDITGNLGTAVAQVNGLPRDITGIMPGLDGMNTYMGYAKWVVSGVSLQEIFGQKIYPIPLHVTIGFTTIMVVSSIMLTFKLVMWFLKTANWIVRAILKIIPFIG